MNNKISLHSILLCINTKYSVDTHITIEGIHCSHLANLSIADENSLCFIDHRRKDKQQLAASTKARVIICDEELQLTNELKDKVLIKVDFPKLVFSIISNELFIKKPSYSIHSSAVIHPEAQIDPEVYIGPFTQVGKAVIGKGTIIYGNSYIADNTSVGQNVILYAGCVLGMEGYGYNRTQEKFPVQFPHVGGIIIEDYVEVGANSCIDRGALGDTIIGYGSKIDNLVHIGHNVNIGKCVYVAAQTTIAGSCMVDDFAEIWTAVGIADNLKIGNSSSVGIGSIVIQSIPERKKCFGNPARVIGTNDQ